MSCQRHCRFGEWESVDGMSSRTCMDCGFTVTYTAPKGPTLREREQEASRTRMEMLARQTLMLMGVRRG